MGRPFCGRSFCRRPFCRRPFCLCVGFTPHGGGWARQYVAFVDLIHLNDLNNDDVTLILTSRHLKKVSSTYKYINIATFDIMAISAQQAAPVKIWTFLSRYFYCLAAVCCMTSSKYCVKDSIFLSCFQRFLTLNCSVTNITFTV